MAILVHQVVVRALLAWRLGAHPFGYPFAGTLAIVAASSCVSSEQRSPKAAEAHATEDDAPLRVSLARAPQSRTGGRVPNALAEVKRLLHSFGRCGSEPEASGRRVVVHARVGREGRVLAVWTSPSDIDQATAGCLSRVMRQARFLPPIGSGEAILTSHLTFTSVRRAAGPRLQRPKGTFQSEP